LLPVLACRRFPTERYETNEDADQRKITDPEELTDAGRRKPRARPVPLFTVSMDGTQTGTRVLRIQIAPTKRDDEIMHNFARTLCVLFAVTVLSSWAPQKLDSQQFCLAAEIGDHD
jgi:hypothetical protein